MARIIKMIDNLQKFKIGDKIRFKNSVIKEGDEIIEITDTEYIVLNDKKEKVYISKNCKLLELAK